MPAASWFLRMAEPDPVMSKRCCAPGTNLSRTMRREPSGRTVPGHDPPPPGLRRGTIPAFYRKMQELQRWHADSQNTPSWLCFLIYTIILLCCSKRSLFRRMKNFLTSFAWHGGSGGGGCVFAGRPSRFCRKESFLSYQELITKRKVGRGAPHFAADGAASAAGRPSPGEGAAGGRKAAETAAGTGRHDGRAAGGKKGRPPMTVALIGSGGKAYWPRSTSAGFSSRSSRNLSGRSFWSGTVMSPWTYSR